MTSERKSAPGDRGAADVTVHLVRHGQSEWNRIGRIQGQTPHVPLTELGHAQARAAAAALVGRGVGAVHSSDQVRAWQTADVVARAVGLEARSSAALRERNLGRLQGRICPGMREQDFGPFTGTLPVATDGPPGTDPLAGAEPLDDVYRRVGGLLATLVADPAGPAIAVVSHGIAIRMCVAWLCGLVPDDRFPLATANGSITTVQLVGGVATRIFTERPSVPGPPVPH